MSIRFRCDRCGHTFDVDDRFEGKHGKCKHCGHHLEVPGHATDEPHQPAPLRLRPIEGGEAPGPADHLLAPPAPLKVRAAEEDPRVRPHAISDPDEPPLRPDRKSSQYAVLDPHHLGESHGRSGPPPLWTLFPSLTARFVARQFRTLRDWLYLVSLACLVIVLLGYLFQWKILLHLGAVGVVASNIAMLCVGAAYLVTLPFKESLHHGLANLFIPFYAVYYWWSRWPSMKTAVFKTAGAFLPIALVGLAYLVYEEAPVVEKAIERELPALEKKIETTAPELDRKVTRTLDALKNEAESNSNPKP
jgi:hypothetical protein